MYRVKLLLPPREREHRTYARLRDWTDPASALSLFANPMASVPVPAAFQKRFVTWTLGADGGDAHIWTRRD